MKKNYILVSILVAVTMLLAGCSTEPEIRKPETPQQAFEFYMEDKMEYDTSIHIYKDFIFEKEAIDLAYKFAKDESNPLQERYDATFLVYSWERENDENPSYYGETIDATYPMSKELFLGITNEIAWGSEEMHQLIGTRENRYNSTLSMWLSMLDQEITELFAPRFGAIMAVDVSDQMKSTARDLSKNNDVTRPFIKNSPYNFFQAAKIWLDYDVMTDEEIWPEMRYVSSDSTVWPYSLTMDEYVHWYSYLSDTNGYLAMTNHIADAVVPASIETSPKEVTTSDYWMKVEDHIWVPNNIVKDHEMKEIEESKELEKIGFDISKFTKATTTEKTGEKMLVVQYVPQSDSKAYDSSLPELKICYDLMTAMPGHMVPSSLEDIDSILILHTTYDYYGEYVMDSALQEIRSGYTSVITAELYDYNSGQHIESFGEIVTSPKDEIVASVINMNYYAVTSKGDILLHLADQLEFQLPTIK